MELILWAVYECDIRAFELLLLRCAIQIWPSDFQHRMASIYAIVLSLHVLLRRLEGILSVFRWDSIFDSDVLADIFQSTCNSEQTYEYIDFSWHGCWTIITRQCQCSDQESREVLLRVGNDLHGYYTSIFTTE